MANSNQNTPTLPKTGFLRLPQVLSLFPIGKSTWWEGVKNGRFPQPVKLGPHTTAWKAEDIKKLIDDYDHTEWY